MLLLLTNVMFKTVYSSQTILPEWPDVPPDCAMILLQCTHGQIPGRGPPLTSMQTYSLFDQQLSPPPPPTYGTPASFSCARGDLQTATFSPLSLAPRGGVNGVVLVMDVVDWCE